MTSWKILIVDDSRVVRQAFQARLEAEGYKVCTAEDASSALAAARDFKPHVVLMDVNFPADVGTVSWDGFRLLAWLRSTGAITGARAIIITSDPPEKHEQQARLLRVDGLLQKPVRVTELLAVLKRCTSGVVLTSGAAPIIR